MPFFGSGGGGAAASNMVGATSSAAGTAGLVPAPSIDDRGLLLQGNATWSAYPTIIRPDQLPRLRCWLDASSTYITKDGSDLVSSWTDRAGISNFSQATAARQPKWFAGTDSTHAINSKPVVWFDGANGTSGNRDFMKRAAHLDLNDGYTMFAVARMENTSTSVSKFIFTDDNSAGTTLSYTLCSNGGNPAKMTWGHGNGGNYQVYRGGAAATGVQMLVSRRFGTRVTSYSMRRNGAFFAADTIVGSDTTMIPTSGFGDSTLGAGSDGTGAFFDGDIASLIVYDIALSDTEIIGVEAWLNAQFNVF
jgi:hypothetical protein